MKRIIAFLLAAVLCLSLCACGKSGGSSASSKSSSSSSSSSSSYSSGSSSVEMDHSTYCLLYMKVSDVEVTHKHNYTYVSGSITNNGDYRIKFVKVKASCKDASGKVVDTDWTYAVDSSWLEPGESNTFEMMIKDEDAKIKKADVSVVLD